MLSYEEIQKNGTIGSIQKGSKPSESQTSAKR